MTFSNNTVTNFSIKTPSNNIIQQMRHTFFRYTTSQNDIIKIMSFSSRPKAQSPQIKLILHPYLIIYHALVTGKRSESHRNFSLGKVLQQIAKKKEPIARFNS